MSDEPQMLSAEAERFERRLTQEISDLRVEFHEQISSLRAEMYRELNALRLELHDGLTGVRQELRQEMSNLRAELLKWSFLFWIGQVATMAVILSDMLRGVTR